MAESKKKKHAGGAKSKHTPDVVTQILELIRAGNYESTAFQAVGISEATFYDWKKNKPEFSQAIKKAESEAVQSRVAIVMKAARKSWTAAAWYLERKRPDEWSLKQKVEHLVPEPIQFIIRKAAPKETPEPA